ncbi:MAG: glycerol acyltransferase [Bacteroidales bacterium]|nr:glycerol acyltransferase [Bacteroidales bacterium]
MDNFIESDGSIGKYLLLSTHRDIVLDPALIQMALYRAGYPCTEIAVGDNLLANSDIEDAMRSNRMIKVVRSDNPRVVYTTSKLLSAYMRERITQGESSVWIAHRQGRTKDGNDATEQGLLKMLNMSANNGFTESFAELRIMPVAVSYEYETCGALKALELYMKEQQGFYRKAPGEDTNSMLQGFIQPKGRVHIAFGKPLTLEEIKSADAAEHNDKFRNLAQIIDGHLLDLFKLWPTNYAAADILGGSDTHFKDGKYSEADKVAFTEHIKKETEGMPEAIYRRLLELYAAHINNQNK